jgi:hypothetical protein
MSDQDTYQILCEMHKQLVMIAAHLGDIAKSARAEHPRTLNRQEARPTAPREAPPVDRPDHS